MKKLVCIVWLLIGVISQSYASHFLGAEITYKHISDYKYTAFVTVYRDCNECKIAGAGGGSNTKDCGGFDLFLGTSDKSTCSRKYLKTLSLTRENIVEILPLCKTASSKCQSDTGLSFGVEAHIFSVDIDFEEYKSYESCGFELYVQLISRAGDIDNLLLSTEEERLYNFCFINPFEEHDSPTFTENPQLILPINVPVRTYVSSINSKDSTVVSFEQPQRDADNKIAYNTGYTKERPLTVWCNGDVSCTPNAYATLPVGATLSAKTGYLAFTPIKTNEKATVVVEVNTFRKTVSGYKLISTVRRDILVETAGIGSQNNSPRLQGTSLGTDNELEVCVGQNLCFDITAEDKPYKYSDGSFQKNNSVSYKWSTDIVGATIDVKSQSNAPYNKLAVCWSPDGSYAGKSFTLRVTATDDNCPLQASVTQDYKILVKELPQNHIAVQDLWCGNIGLIDDSTNSNLLHEVDWTIYNAKQEVKFHSLKLSDTVYLGEKISGLVQAVLTNKLGCKDTFIAPVVRNESDYKELFTSIKGKMAFCVGDTLKFESVGVKDVTIDSAHWDIAGQQYKTGVSLIETTDVLQNTNKIQSTVFGNKNNLSCVEEHTLDIILEDGPKIRFDNLQSICETEESLDLSSIVEPLNGTWKGIDHSLIDVQQLQVAKLGNISTSVNLCQEYSALSPSSGCISKDTFCVWVHPKPELDLTTTTVCGATGFFNLTNMDSKLFSFGDYNIAWLIDGKPLAKNETNKPHTLELVGLNFGDYEVIGNYTNVFGCSTLDTGILSLSDNINLDYVTDKNICQDDNRSLSDVFSISIIGGSWNSTTDFEDVLDLQFRNPDSCGVIGLNYTYDQYGCYVTKDVKLNVECKPIVQFSLHDSICQFQDFYDLKANPAIGRFEGEFISANQLDLLKSSGVTSFNYIVDVNACSFKYPQTIEVFNKPTYTVDTPLQSSICEDQDLAVLGIDVSNGWLRITNPLGIDEVITSKQSWTYSPTKSDVDSRKVSVLLQLEGIGHCPIPEENKFVEINPTAKLELETELVEGCNPLNFSPKFTALQTKGLFWKDVNVNWDYGDGSKLVNKLKPNHNYKVPGLYTVTVHTETNKGCSYSKSWDQLVKVNESPMALFTTLPGDQVSIRDPNVSFVNTTPNKAGLSFHWDFGTGNSLDTSSEFSPSFIFASDTGVYPVTLTVKNEYGCEDVFMRNVYVGPDIKIYIPSAFSPNNKGSEITEEFKVIGQNVSSFHIEIFNRWGQQVYKSEDISEEWDGKSGGRFCEIGIYAYLITATSNSGASYEFSGTINILR